MASQKLKKIKPHCEFINNDCQREKCAAFKYRRAMSTQERKRYNSADIPVTDLYVYNWCLKYDKQLFIIYRIEETQ